VTRFRFVEQEKARYPVRILCRAVGVSPSGYYAWRTRAPSTRERSDAALAAEIRRSHARSRGTYGVPRIHTDLVEAGYRVSRKRVARLMRRDHLAGVHVRQGRHPEGHVLENLYVHPAQAEHDDRAEVGVGGHSQYRLLAAPDHLLDQHAVHRV